MVSLREERGKWPFRAARLALAAGALLSCHLIFVLAESFSISTLAELPFSFFSLIFWLMLYGADPLGPLLLVVLRWPSVQARLD